MRPKFFTKEVETFLDGSKHVILVVGKWQKKKVNKATLVYTDKSIAITNTPKFEYSLTLGKAICHPDDKFDAEVGMKLALKRIKEGGLGKVVTEDYTMLTADACQVIVDNKANYIAANIKRFIPNE